MKRELKAVAAFAITMIVNIIINVICNKHGVDLNTSATTIVSILCFYLIYWGLTRNENINNEK